MAEAEKPDIVAALEYYGAVGIRADSQHNKVSCISGEHSDSNPSMTVDTRKGLYKCFSCSFAGDAYTLVMKKEDCDFSNAKQLCEERGWLSDQAVSRGPTQPGRRVRASLFTRERPNTPNNRGVQAGPRTRPRLGS